ncbi:uncharacterized protein METZ01_LOCUS75221, partial [marine metagenome]
MRHQQPEKTLNPPGTATPMRPRPFLLLLAGFALVMLAAFATPARAEGLDVSP